MTTIDTLNIDIPAARSASGKLVQFSVESSWQEGVSNPAQTVAVREQLDAVVAAGRRVFDKYPDTLRRLAE